MSEVEISTNFSTTSITKREGVNPPVEKRRNTMRNSMLVTHNAYTPLIKFTKPRSPLGSSTHLLRIITFHRKPQRSLSKVL